MQYVSTRGQSPSVSFEEAVLSGLARDGGLLVPEFWPRFDRTELTALAHLDYQELAVRVMAPFIGSEIAAADFEAMVATAYRRFDRSEVTPLRPLGANEWLLELFHGPTLAFKDIALQLVGGLFQYFLARSGRRVTLVGATSGDTGSAAIEACRDQPAIQILMLHPRGKISEVQRRQMTTVLSPNVRNIAIEGNFDDCQDLVKKLFGDMAFRDELGLSTVNSINWARVMAQSVYYFFAGLALGAPERGVNFAVPTGNFGDIFAGYVARSMGLPINRLVIASNLNDILTRTFTNGTYAPEQVRSTLSPSMDIQVSSNFERLLFDLYDRDSQAVAALMTDLADTGSFALDPEHLRRARELMDAARIDEAETLAIIAEIHENHDILVDPHTAVGIGAGRKCWQNRETPMVYLATADPAKFPDAVEKATGKRPQLPPRLAGLLDREERYDVLPNDLACVRDYIRSFYDQR